MDNNGELFRCRWCELESCCHRRWCSTQRFKKSFPAVNDAVISGIKVRSRPIEVLAPVEPRQSVSFYTQNSHKTASPLLIRTAESLRVRCAWTIVYRASPCPGNSSLSGGDAIRQGTIKDRQLPVSERIEQPFYTEIRGWCLGSWYRLLCCPMCSTPLRGRLLPFPSIKRRRQTDSSRGRRGSFSPQHSHVHSTDLFSQSLISLVTYLPGCCYFFYRARYK